MASIPSTSLLSDPLVRGIRPCRSVIAVVRDDFVYARACRNATKSIKDPAPALSTNERARASQTNRTGTVHSPPLFFFFIEPKLTNGPHHPSHHYLPALLTSTAGLPPLMVGPSEHSSIAEHHSDRSMSMSKEPIGQGQGAYVLCEHCIYD